MKNFFNKYLYHFLVSIILCIHLFLLLNIKFTAWPEMLTYPWLMKMGFNYYGDIIQPYLPLLSFTLYCFYKIFGLSIISLKIYTFIIIIFSDILIFAISKKLYNRKTAYIALSLFIILQVFFEGNGLWFDLASLPLILLSYYCLLIWKNKQYKIWLILSGFILGLAVLTKQNNCIYILPASLLILNKLKPTIKSDIKNVLYFIFCTVLPLLILISIYYFSSQFNAFIYWSLWHPLFIQAKMPGFASYPKLKQLLIIIYIFSPVILIFRKNLILAIWFIFSLIFVIPRFGYFHLQHAAAFFCLLFPQIFIKQKKIVKYAVVVYTSGVLLLFIKFFLREYNQPVRFFEPNIILIRKLLETKIPNHEPVLFYNLSSEYFVNTSLIPIKPWAYEFPWYMEISGIQEKIVENLENNRTNYVVYMKHKNEGELIPGSYKPILIDDYINKNYTIYKQINSDIFILKRDK